MNKYVIYTDGGCHNNGNLKGLGAWAFVKYCTNADKSIIHAQRVINTTNNRTEMMAVINAILSCEKGSEIDIISDSGYVVKGYVHPSYLDKWVSTGWKTSNGKQVSNIDLWNEILGLSYHYKLKFTLVRGHNKDKNPIHAYWNSIVDEACTYVMHKIGNNNEPIQLLYDHKSRSFEMIDSGGKYVIEHNEL